MSRLRLYVDEDAMDGDLVRGLRSRGLDVVTATDAGMIRRKDDEHLELATVQGRVLYSFNVGDFDEIHTLWSATGREHAGIILAHQKRYSTGDQIRRLLRLMGSLTKESDEKPGRVSGPLVKNQCIFPVTRVQSPGRVS